MQILPKHNRTPIESFPHMKNIIISRPQVLALLVFLCSSALAQPTKNTQGLPNIIWITCEDINPFLGSYGDKFAITPYLDKLANEGVRFTQAYANAPVCSPARSALITGIYATSMGTQHLRSEVAVPKKVKALPDYLRSAGYYCTNNDKEDYNFTESSFWDESNKKAHWRNRPNNKPFFSVFNIGTTHQSQIFGSDEAFHEKYGHLLAEQERHDPDGVTLPTYFADTPITRKMWARYYDLVTLMDKQVGEILQQLKEDGLEENTIIFFFSDHGTGMPRSKRALYDSGLKVPLLIKAPDNYSQLLGLAPNSVTNSLVSFVDFAPTILSILNTPTPEEMQGTPFLGKFKTKAPEYIIATADRVDEGFEAARSVRNERYSYVRNYFPHLPLIQSNYYTDQSEVMIELYRAHKEEKLTKAQQSMWLPHRAVEELYDRQNDPDEVNNLAADPAYLKVLSKMRKAQQQWSLKTHDSGMIPEPMMHKLAENTTVYDMIRNENVFPQQEVMHTANLMLKGKEALAALQKSLTHKNAIVRFWAIIGLQVIGEDARSATNDLTKLLKDQSSSIQIQASEALCTIGACEKSLPLLISIASGQSGPERLMACRALEQLDDKILPAISEVRKLQQTVCTLSEGKWYGYDLYACWALNEALKKLDKK